MMKHEGQVESRLMFTLCTAKAETMLSFCAAVYHIICDGCSESVRENTILC